MDSLLLSLPIAVASLLPVASGSNISQTVNLTTVNPAPTVNPALQIKGDYSEKPTPADIENQLDALPAFQRNKMKDDYVGLKVSWPVSVSSLFGGGRVYSKVEKS